MPTFLNLSFLVLRTLTGFASLIALGILALIVMAQTLFQSAKETVDIFAAVAVLFTSAFQKTRPVRDHIALNILPHQIALVFIFLLMLVSTFFPGAKVFLHSVAVLGALAAAWCVWITVATPGEETIFVPFLGMWFLYYAICALWAWKVRTA